LIAVSPEAAPASADNAGAEGTRFPVLVDHGGKVAEQFGLAFEMVDAARNVLKSSGVGHDAVDTKLARATPVTDAARS